MLWYLGVIVDPCAITAGSAGGIVLVLYWIVDIFQRYFSGNHLLVFSTWNHLIVLAGIDSFYSLISRLNGISRTTEADEEPTRHFVAIELGQGY